MRLIDEILWRPSPFPVCHGLPSIPTLAEQARLAAEHAARGSGNLGSDLAAAVKSMRPGARRDVLTAMVPGAAYTLAQLKVRVPGNVARRDISCALTILVSKGLIRKEGTPGRYRYTRLKLDL